jgi:hypothetical protein
VGSQQVDSIKAGEEKEEGQEKEKEKEKEKEEGEDSRIQGGKQRAGGSDTQARSQLQRQDTQTEFKQENGAKVPFEHKVV